MKKVLYAFLISLSVIVILLLFYINYLAPGITGYAAKYIASGVFVAGRTQESLEKEELNFFPVYYSKTYVDYDNKEVTSRLFSVWKSTAVFNEGLGCTLVEDFSKEEVLKMDYPKVSLPEGDPDTIPWPQGDLLSDSVPSGIDKARLNTILDRSFYDTSGFIGTFSVAVVYKDQIVAEKYRDDFTSESRFLSWSMAKSFTNAMVGAMVKEGRADIHTPLNLKEWAGDDRQTIALDHLMKMTSGLDFLEKYSKIRLTGTTTMLLKNGDMGNYAASYKLLAKPDSIWYYSSGSSNIIQDYIRTLFDNDEEYLAFPRKEIFNKTGMRSVIWEPDASGTFVGSSYLYATLRDYARFGLLYLHNGNWLGDQILPEDWVRYTTNPANGSNGSYGALFWLNRGNEFPGIPEDLFYCDGYEGQRIFIIPSKQLVIVRTGCSDPGEFNWQLFLEEIIAATE
ncbi:MAG: serine hydrolase [Bacteroidales bacterium]|jgi:CubicO group peptidase (beta-lactamase class C family)|nr:serine hydrolase [Bacteroidales bacterium]